MEKARSDETKLEEWKQWKTQEKDTVFEAVFVQQQTANPSPITTPSVTARHSVESAVFICYCKTQCWISVFICYCKTQCWVSTVFSSVTARQCWVSTVFICYCKTVFSQHSFLICYCKTVLTQHSFLCVTARQCWLSTVFSSVTARHRVGSAQFPSVTARHRVESVQFSSWYSHNVFIAHNGSSAQMHYFNLINKSSSNGLVLTVDIFSMLKCRASIENTVTCRMWIKAIPVTILFSIHLRRPPRERICWPHN
jgi:hypothetical protein